MQARPRIRQEGFALIDTMVSVVVISVSTVGFLAASVTSTALEKENRTVAAANELSRAVVEQMLAMPIAEVLPSYNASPTDDPKGAGTAAGDAFQLLTTDTQMVRSTTSGLIDTTTGLLGGLLGGGSSGSGRSGSGSSGSGSSGSGRTGTGTIVNTVDTVADAGQIPKVMDCRIQMPTLVDAAGVETLREDMNAPEFGLPADLNGDGVIDGKNHSGDYKVLPVVIRLDWPTADGGVRSVTFTTVVGGGKAP